MVDHWLELSSAEYDSHCGDSEGHTILGALDGTDAWWHAVYELHEFILDLGQTYTIKKVRGRSNTDGYDPTNINIYVSDSKIDWGATVATNVDYSDTSTWVETDITDKDGRYIKVVIGETESASHYLQWGGVSPDYFTIFDAYGDVTAPPPIANQTMTFAAGSKIICKQKI